MGNYHTTGFVSFPFHNPLYKCSGEGGLYVDLVVTAQDVETRPCCIQYPRLSLQEVLISDGWRFNTNSPWPSSEELSRMSDRAVRELLIEDQRNPAVEYHFPDYDGSGMNSSLLSIPYHACISLGATNWSGYSETLGRYWFCTKGDLSSEGRELYDCMSALYPSEEIYLLTWLDT